MLVLWQYYYATTTPTAVSTRQQAIFLKRIALNRIRIGSLSYISHTKASKWFPAIFPLSYKHITITIWGFPESQKKYQSLVLWLQQKKTHKFEHTAQLKYCDISRTHSFTHLPVLHSCNVMTLRMQTTAAFVYTRHVYDIERYVIWLHLFVFRVLRCIRFGSRPWKTKWKINF